MKLTGAQILREALVREGVSDVFGYPGGAILPAYDAMLSYPIRHVLVRHEQGATHMADGYARASGRLGVAVATSGPGATNMVTGIATAMMDSSPIVCITGQVGSKLLGIGGVPASHPLNLGMMGMHGEAWVNTAIQEADLLIALGMRFDDRVTGNLKTYARSARKIHVDIDRAELNKNVRVDVAIAKDLRAALNEWQPLVAPGDRSAWLAHIQALKGDVAVRDIQNLPDNGHLYAAHVINDLWRITAGGALVVTDVGQHQMWEAQYYKHDRSRSLITSGGLGTMGFALPAAIGAKIACPDAEVWVVVGDGGFQMTMCELATVVQEHLDINVAIINNGYLGMVRQWQEFFYDKHYAATPITGPNFAKLAEAFGFSAATITTRAQVADAVEAARRQKRAALIDFQVEQEDSVYPMVPAGADLNKMIRRPSPSPIVETAAD